MDRANVGGSQSGQQSSYVSRGTPAPATTSGRRRRGHHRPGGDGRLAGLLRLRHAGGDADLHRRRDVTQQTGGVGINLVTKSGTDQFRGSGRYFVTDDTFGPPTSPRSCVPTARRRARRSRTSRTTASRAAGRSGRAVPGSGAAYSKQDIKVGVVTSSRTRRCPVNAPDPLPAIDLSVREFNGCLNTDLTELDNYNIKGSVLLFSGNTFTWHSNFADKIRNARDVSDTRPHRDHLQADGPGLDAQGQRPARLQRPAACRRAVAHVGGGFALRSRTRGSGASSRRSNLDRPVGPLVLGQEFDRPADSVDLTATYFLPAALGGDHAFKSGFHWRDTPSVSTIHGAVTPRRAPNGVPGADLFATATAYSLTTSASTCRTPTRATG